MCGIVGHFGSPDLQLIRSMLKSLKHRGPDDEGVFSDDSIALGAVSSETANIRHGRQPMHNKEEIVWIAFDGEICNFLDIRRELIKLGHEFNTGTDTETIIHAYEEWDVDCLKRFNGMFAFALWDKNKGRLFLVRDRMGIKPVYYYARPDKLLFASEIKALIVDPEILRKPNDRVVYNFLLTGFQSMTGATFFENINELPPAHYMTVDEDHTNLERYWSLTASEPKEPKTNEFYACALRELLFDAVRIRLPKNLAIGSFLSGGLDSTSLVCLVNSIARARASNLKSNSEPINPNHNSQRLFSALYHEAVCDERPFIEEVSRFVGTKVDYVFPSALIRLDDIKTFAHQMDEPVTVLNYYVYWCLARMAKGQVKVTFSGQGPDETLAGHPDHFETYVKELWKRRKIRELLIELSASLYRYGPLSVMKRVATTTKLGRARVEELLHPKFVASHEKDTSSKSPDSLNSILLLDATQNRLPMHLRVNDRVGSTFSIESELPYLDHRIVEFCFALPKEQKIKHAWNKYVLRNAVKGLIPESIRKRKKAGTPIPLSPWMKDLRYDIRQVFHSNRFRKRGYFNQAKILDICDRYYNRKLGHSLRQFYGEVLWRILNLELWLEIFFDHEDTIN
jgi:asparagine synthase (glutamine-hydrolysing)